MSQQNLAVADQIDQQTKPVATADMLFADGMLERLEKFALIMSKGRSTVPQHLSGNQADCMAVAMQAAQWKMNPYAVAQKTHLVHGTLGYEAQLVNAVITAQAPTKDRLNYEWFGPWENVIGKFKEKDGKNGKYTVPDWSLHDEKGCGVKVWATFKGEEEPRTLELLLSQASVRNSTLWASDPKQQLAYLAVKRWSRLYCPDVIMGVYTPDELEELPSQPDPKDITPANDLNASIQGEVVNAEAPTADDMIEAIEKAQSSQALKAAIADVDLLPEGDVDRVRKAYSTKVDRIKKSRASDQGSAPSYAEVVGKINRAQALDDLDVAESLISSVADAEQRKELQLMADKVRTQFNNMFNQ